MARQPRCRPVAASFGLDTRGRDRHHRVVRSRWVPLLAAVAVATTGIVAACDSDTSLRPSDDGGGEASASPGASSAPLRYRQARRRRHVLPGERMPMGRSLRLWLPARFPEPRQAQMCRAVSCGLSVRVRERLLRRGLQAERCWLRVRGGRAGVRSRLLRDWSGLRRRRVHGVPCGSSGALRRHVLCVGRAVRERRVRAPVRRSRVDRLTA